MFSPARRIFTKVVFDGACWRWTGSRNRYGYGHMKIDKRRKLVHRVLFELARGPIPERLEVDHLCRNRWCVNPEHMEPVTRRENILRGESFAANNARSTHCVAGHEWTPENTLSRPGGRNCRACRSRRNAEYYQRCKAKEASNV